MKSLGFLPYPLTREQFATAIQRGLGRAFVHVKQFGIENVKDIVLNACVHNLTWDPQCEGERAKWLLGLFADTKYSQDFSNRIISALETETVDNDSVVDQLFGIAKEMALAGNEQAKAAIGKRALEIARMASEGVALGADEWIEVAGIDGFLGLIRIYGKSLIDDKDAWVPEYEIPLEYQSTVFERAKNEPEIQVYLDYVAANAIQPDEKKSREQFKQERREGFRKKYPLELILEWARDKKEEYPYYYRTFGKYATEQELISVYSVLLTEEDNDVRVRLLWVFRAARLPRVDEFLLNWAVQGGMLQEPAIWALSQVKDIRIHDLAINMVNSNRLSDGLELLISNLEVDDVQPIMNKLREIKPSDQDAHRIVWLIIDIAKNFQDAALTQSLIWSYSATPCSNCRWKVVKQLEVLNKFDDDILEESLYDADEEIRDIAKKTTEALRG
jgi:hypothetical protein